MVPKLTFENQKFCEDGHKLVVFYPASCLKLVPQSSEGFIVQIKFCETKKQVIPSDSEEVSALSHRVVATAGRNGLFQLLSCDRGGNPALVTFHILPPDRGHKLLQFKDLHQIQISRFVCLKVLVTRNNHDQTLNTFSQVEQLVVS